MIAVKGWTMRCMGRQRSAYVDLSQFMVDSQNGSWKKEGGK